MEAAVPAEASPMPEPTRETIPTPVHDVKPPAPPIEEQRNQSATREETPKALRNGLTGLLNERPVGVRQLGDLLLGGASEPQTSRIQSNPFPARKWRSLSAMSFILSWFFRSVGLWKALSDGLTNAADFGKIASGFSTIPSR